MIVRSKLDVGPKLEEIDECTGGMPCAKRSNPPFAVSNPFLPRDFLACKIGRILLHAPALILEFCCRQALALHFLSMGINNRDKRIFHRIRENAQSFQS